ncbi:hypothetical protein BJY01DRAFT_255934 [Aspergillus pseudoustus]|uniref:Secreted protein n=1 Tax=Aspergillus pseudoustus TaxID=1810923 RepID=A0ABR4IFN9_9EURO
MILRMITYLAILQLAILHHGACTPTPPPPGPGAPLTEPIVLILYGDLNCQDGGMRVEYTFSKDDLVGEQAWGGLTLASFRLSRPLRGKEQLDISGPEKLGEWITSGNHPRDKACAKFQRSFFAQGSTTNCQNMDRPFTCANIWTNPGL